MSLPLYAEFTPFIKKQIDLVHQRNDDNVTQEKIEILAQEEKKLYLTALENLLRNKTKLEENDNWYASEIYLLEKKIKYNKRRGNKYAVMRDEVLIKSYKIIRAQNNMVISIFRAMDYYDMEELVDRMNKQFVKVQEEIDQYMQVDYSDILKISADHRIIKQAQNNIKDFHAIIEINADILNYLILNKNRIYRLNKYKNYGILEIAIFLDHTKVGGELNDMLHPYHLSVVKLLLIFVISVFIYLIRILLFKFIELLLLKVNFLTQHTKEVIDDIRRPVNYILIFINLDMIMYIYHDFNDTDLLNKFFNISYSLLISYVIYRILNSIASIQINQIQQSEKKIKSEMVNVTIKIFNFIMIILTLLLVLHFAGANLTTVLSGLGIGGFAVAFAARETLSNFLGTISILMSDTYSQGDWIVIDDMEGTVVEIGLRVTTLRTFDNALISIPNGVIANKDVKNWNKRTIGRRIKMSIAVTYDSKPEQLQKAIHAIREVLVSHPDIASDKTTYDEGLVRKSAKLVSQEDELGIKRTLMVNLDEFADSSINILIVCFTKKIAWNEWLETKEDLMFKIMEILENYDLKFALPALSLHQAEKPA